MKSEINDLPPPVNHVFVDYENVHALDPAIIGSKTVHVTLLLCSKKTKLDATMVEKLMQHAATVEMIRLTSSRRNALDFTLAYYLGRAVLADPCGCFHIVSKDKGYDALIEHLRGKHMFARRHEDFPPSHSPQSPNHPPQFRRGPPLRQSHRPSPSFRLPWRHWRRGFSWFAGGPPNWGNICESLIMTRLMSGSRENLEIDVKALQGMTDYIQSFAARSKIPTPVGCVMLALLAAYMSHSFDTFWPRICPF